MVMLVSLPLCSLHLSTTTTTRLWGTHKGAAKLEVIRRRENDGEGQGGMKKNKKLISKATLSRTTNTPTQHKDSNTLPQSQVGGGGGEREERGELVVKNEVGGGGERGKRGGEGEEREERGEELEQEENTLPQSEVGTRGERGELVGVIKPSPSPSSGLLSAILDGLERAIVSAFCSSTPEPLHFISSPNFGPTTETPPHTQLPISGHLPDCLNGEFALIGSNPKHEPVAGYHWFDGDGMIHGLRIKDGNATYVSRYVQTSRLLQEEYFGGAKFIKMG